MASLTNPPTSSKELAAVICCPDCGTVLDGVSTKINRLEEELNRAHHELKRLRGQVTSNKAEMSKRDKEAYEFWLSAHNKDPKLKVNAFGPSGQAGLARARKYGLSQEDILKVIGTHARYPFLVYGHWSMTGAPRDRKDSLKDAFKDDERWKALLTLADAPPPTTHDRRTEARGDGWSVKGSRARASRLARGRDPIVEFTEALEHANCSPKFSYDQQGNALCPAHDDTQKSLRFKEGNDGRVLVHCLSHNCTPEAICAALGLTLADLFPRRSA